MGEPNETGGTSTASASDLASSVAPEENTVEAALWPKPEPMPSTWTQTPSLTRRASPLRWLVLLAGAWGAVRLLLMHAAQRFFKRYGRWRREFGRWLLLKGSATAHVLEALVIPWIALVLGAQARPQDPLFSGADFPWTWLGVWLVALRYGSLWAVPGVLAFVLVWGHVNGWNWAAWPRAYFLGGALTTLLIGEFTSMWRSRATAYADMRQELEHNTQVLTRRLYLMKLSHDDLEAEIVERPATLRDALRDLRATMKLLTRHEDDPIHALPGAGSIMAFLESHCALMRAGMYRVQWKGGWQLEEVARLGRTRNPSVHDPLFVESLRWDRLVHRQIEQVDDLGSEMLAACVLRDATGEPYALLAVFQMPLLSLTEDNLRKLGVLFESYGDYLHILDRIGSLGAELPEVPRELLGECESWIRLGQRHGEVSQLVVWRARSDDAELAEQALLTLLERHAVGANAWVWPPGAQGAGLRCVVVVLGLADASAMRGYARRLRGEVEQLLGEEGVRTLRHRARPLDSADALRWLRDELKEPAP